MTLCYEYIRYGLLYSAVFAVARISCFELPAIANGVIRYSSSELLFGVTASYTCNPGFGLSTGNSTRMCDGDGSTTNGTWTGDTPVCKCTNNIIHS